MDLRVNKQRCVSSSSPPELHSAPFETRLAIDLKGRPHRYPPHGSAVVLTTAGEGAEEALLLRGRLGGHLGRPQRGWGGLGDRS